MLFIHGTFSWHTFIDDTVNTFQAEPCQVGRSPQIIMISLESYIPSTFLVNVCFITLEHENPLKLKRILKHERPSSFVCVTASMWITLFVSMQFQIVKRFKSQVRFSFLNTSILRHPNPRFPSSFFRLFCSWDPSFCCEASLARTSQNPIVLGLPSRHPRAIGRFSSHLLSPQLAIPKPFYYYYYSAPPVFLGPLCYWPFETFDIFHFPIDTLVLEIILDGATRPTKMLCGPQVLTFLEKVYREELSILARYHEKQPCGQDPELL